MRALLYTASAVVAALLLLPGTAAADVQVAASNASSGARDVTITFRVTNDDPAVPTTRLHVFLPPARPLLGVVVTAPTGWTAHVTTAPPAPITTDDEPADEVVTTVEWTGGSLVGMDDAVFPIHVAQLPVGAGPVRFRVIQTYADRSAVEWSDIEPAGGPAPAHPSLVVPYADVTALPAEPGHRHHGGVRQDLAVGAADAGSALRTLGFAMAGVAVFAGAVAALGRRQRRRLHAVWAGRSEPGDPECDQPRG